MTAHTQLVLSDTTHTMLTLNALYQDVHRLTHTLPEGSGISGIRLGIRIMDRFGRNMPAGVVALMHIAKGSRVALDVSDPGNLVLSLAADRGALTPREAYLELTAALTGLLGGWVSLRIENWQVQPSRPLVPSPAPKT
ncbi:MAG: hypothetical protein M3O22_03375 [Pseudomonadota bacterium]|nr:hypothetical protein [Pseudomonadota bacterium]